MGWGMKNRQAYEKQSPETLAEKRNKGSPFTAVLELVTEKAITVWHDQNFEGQNGSQKLMHRVV